MDSNLYPWAVVALLVEHSALDWSVWVRGLPGKTSPCTLMSPGACKIHCRCNVLQVPFQNYTSAGTKGRKPSHKWQIKIVMACLQTILRDESQTISNSLLCFCSPTLNPTYLPGSSLGGDSYTVGNNSMQNSSSTLNWTKMASYVR